MKRAYTFEAEQVSQILFNHLWASKLIAQTNKPTSVMTEWRLHQNPQSNSITLTLDLPAAWEVIAEAQRRDSKEV